MPRNCERCGKACDFRQARCRPCRDATDRYHGPYAARLALGGFLGTVGGATMASVGVSVGAYLRVANDPGTCEAVAALIAASGVVVGFVAGFFGGALHSAARD